MPVTLYQIIKSNNIETLKENIDLYDLNKEMNVGHCYLPIEGCIGYDAQECFDFLLDKVNLKLKRDYTPSLLEIALQSNNDHYFDVLIKKDILITTKSMMAVISKKYRNLERLEQILKHPNFKNIDNESLGYFIDDIRDTSVAKILDKHDIQYNKIQLLCVAIKYKKNDLAKYMIEKGIDINAESNTEYTSTKPLVLASKLGNQKMVKLLLDNDADPNVTTEEYPINGNTKSKVTPLVMTLCGERYKKYNVNSYLKCAEMLIKKGANVNYSFIYETQKNKHDTYTILDIAIGKFNHKMINLLFKNGAQIKNESIWSLFIYHSDFQTNRNEDDLEQTLDIINKMMKTNDYLLTLRNGKTLIHHVIKLYRSYSKQQYLPLIQLILDRTGDKLLNIKCYYDDKDTKKYTPFEFSIIQHNHKIFMYLVKMVKKPNVDYITELLLKGFNVKNDKINIRLNSGLANMFVYIYDKWNIKFDDELLLEGIYDLIKYVDECKPDISVDTIININRLKQIYN